MLGDILVTFLISLSPMGEARVGIPYGVIQGLQPWIAFLAGLVANLLVFPILAWFIDRFNPLLWKLRFYRKHSLRIIRRTKKGASNSVRKYGFWGLMVFVMIPLPGTGAYMGTLAAYFLKIERYKAFMAVSIGVLISCLIMAAGSYLGNMGLKTFP